MRFSLENESKNDVKMQYLVVCCSINGYPTQGEVVLGEHGALCPNNVHLTKRHCCETCNLEKSLPQTKNPVKRRYRETKFELPILNPEEIIFTVFFDELI